MKKTARIVIESHVTGEEPKRDTLEMTQLQAKRKMRDSIKQFKDNGYTIFGVVFAADMYFEFKAMKIFTDSPIIELHEYEVAI